MPMYPCHRLTEGGGSQTETLLWENPSPTSDFAAQTITLSEGMSNFDLLKFEIRAHKTALTTIDTVYIPYSFINSTGSGDNIDKFVLGTHKFGATAAREMYKVSDTSIYVSTAQRLNAAYTSNDQIFPYKIYGVKKSSIGGEIPQICSGSYTNIASLSTFTYTATNECMFSVMWDVQYNNYGSRKISVNNVEILNDTTRGAFCDVIHLDSGDSISLTLESSNRTANYGISLV